jgi:hypothetical protein
MSASVVSRDQFFRGMGGAPHFCVVRVLGCAT